MDPSLVWKLGPEKIGIGSRGLHLGLCVLASLCFIRALSVARDRLFQVASKTAVYC